MYSVFPSSLPFYVDFCNSFSFQVIVHVYSSLFGSVYVFITCTSVYFCHISFLSFLFYVIA